MNRTKSYEYRLNRRRRKWGRKSRSDGESVPTVPVEAPEDLPAVPAHGGHIWPDEVKFRLHERDLSAAIRRMATKMRGLTGRDKSKLAQWAGRHSV